MWPRRSLYGLWINGGEWFDGFAKGGIGYVPTLGGQMLGSIRLPQLWSFFHLNSGHLLFEVTGEQGFVERVGDEFLALGDWTFSTPVGWQNAAPGALAYLRALQEKYGVGVVHLPTGGEPDFDAADEAYRLNNSSDDP